MCCYPCPEIERVWLLRLTRSIFWMGEPRSAIPTQYFSLLPVRQSRTTQRWVCRDKVRSFCQIFQKRKPGKSIRSGFPGIDTKAILRFGRLFCMKDCFLIWQMTLIVIQMHPLLRQGVHLALRGVTSCDTYINERN